MVRASVPSPGGFRSTLRHKEFVRLWIAQLISQVVQNATNFAAIALVSHQTNSTTRVGGVFIAFSLPVVLFGIPAGVLVDNFNKRTILWVSNLARALVTFGFIIALLIDNQASLPVYLLTFAISVIGQFFGPAEGASIPLLVEKDNVLPALSLFNITFTISQALGMIILGPLILAFAPTVVLHFGSSTMVLDHAQILFLLITIAYLVCTLLTASLPSRKLAAKSNHIEEQPETGKRLVSLLHGIIEAGDFVRHDALLMVSLLELTLAGTVLNVIGDIAPQFSRDFMNADFQNVGIAIFLPAGIGLIGGSIIMPRIIKRTGLAVAEGIGIAAVSLTILMLTSSHWIAQQINPIGWYHSHLYLAILVVLVFCAGVSLSQMNLPAQTTMQNRSPDWVKGRVLSLQQMLQSAALIPVVPLVGVIADNLGLSVAMNSLAAFIMIAGVGCLLVGEQRGAHSRPLMGNHKTTLAALNNKLGTSDANGPDKKNGHHTAHEVRPPSSPLPRRMQQD
jgi:MFS family permease